MRYRVFPNIKSRNEFRLHSSRVQLVKPNTPRQIYDKFVQTGEMPRFRDGGISTDLDYPVKSFGDVEDAKDFVESMYRKEVKIDEDKKAAEASAKAEREKEMAEAYAKLHNASSPVVMSPDEV